MRRALRLVALTAPLAAGVLVILAGAATPGYDPLTRTVSWLAVPGEPLAGAVDVAIVLVAAACAALALGVEGHSALCRAALVVAGGALIVTAAVHLERIPTLLTAAHRLASGTAMIALAVAAASKPGPHRGVSRALGILELAILASGPALLATSFAAWGAWQRVLLGTAVVWIVFVALTIRTTDAAARASSAALSSRGS